jgi:predicted dehydrogenase
MERQCRWGILGTGKIARIMALALRESAAGRLVAVASRDPAWAREFASLFHPARHYASYAGLIADPEVEIAYVATHHPEHREWAIAAAEAGKHVLCEKPLAMTARAAEEIIEAACRNGVFLMEAFAYRCHPQTRRLVEILRAGEIGEVRMVDACFGYDAGRRPGNYLLDRSLGGGSILDVGCYPTSMAHLIAATASGTAPAATQAVAGAAHIGQATGVDHYAAAVLTFPGGIVAKVASAIQVNLDNALRVYGSGGTVTVPSPWLPGRGGAPATIVIDRPGSPPEVIRVRPSADLYVLEVDAVNGFVRDGQTCHPLMEWDESQANMRTLDRWREAIGLQYDEGRQAGGGMPAARATFEPA